MLFNVNIFTFKSNTFHLSVLHVLSNFLVKKQNKKTQNIVFLLIKD